MDLLRSADATRIHRSLEELRRDHDSHRGKMSSFVRGPNHREILGAQLCSGTKLRVPDEECVFIDTLVRSRIRDVRFLVTLTPIPSLRDSHFHPSHLLAFVHSLFRPILGLVSLTSRRVQSSKFVPKGNDRGHTYRG